MSYRQISIWNILRHEEAFKVLGDYVIANDHEKELTKDQKDMLYSLGMETEGMEFEVKKCKHRPIVEDNGKGIAPPIVDGILFIGKSRTDKKWLNSGNATFDEKLSVADPELRKDIKEMSREFNPSAYMSKEK